MNERQESEIIKRAKAGDKDAFQQLFERYRMVILHYGVWMLKNRSIAEEETQEVFLKAWKKLPTLREEDKFHNWLRSIARAHYLNILRRQRRRLQETSPTKLQRKGCTDEEDADFICIVFGAARGVNPEEILLSKEVGEIIKVTVAQFPTEWREAFSLSCIEGRSEAEGSHIMGCTIPQFRGYKQRARERLQQSLAPHLNSNEQRQINPKMR